MSDNRSYLSGDDEFCSLATLRGECNSLYRQYGALKDKAHLLLIPGRIRLGNTLHEIRHFNGFFRSLETAVPHLGPGALNSLLQCIGSDNTEDNG